MEMEDEMHIILNNSSMVPIYEQIMEQIKSSVVSGKLTEGSALPSVRALATELKISALTVKKAYDRLEEEGFIVTVHGKGSYIAKANTELALESRKQEAERGLAEALDRLKLMGMSREEIYTLIEVLME